MTRKQAREQAFILIFEKQFRDDSAQDIIECAKEIREFESDEYTISTFLGVCDNEAALDEAISAALKGWRIQRISKVALAILRLAVYEIKFVDSVPTSVSINEAVELCKKFATADDAAFVNGVLATVSKQ